MPSTSMPMSAQMPMNTQMPMTMHNNSTMRMGTAPFANSQNCGFGTQPNFIPTSTAPMFKGSIPPPASTFQTPSPTTTPSTQPSSAASSSDFDFFTIPSKPTSTPVTP